MRKFLTEIVRRNVHKVALGYLAVGWLVTEVMSAALPAFNAPDWMPKLVLLLFLLGFPFVLWFAWEFEVTPEGLKRTHEVEPSKSIAGETGQRLNKIIIGVLAMAVTLLLADRFLLSKPEESAPGNETLQSAESISSIAVLPFADFSESADQAYIGNGIADTILHLLAQVPDLKVAARTSSFSFQDRNADIATIASELGVGAVLEGSVQRSGQRLRVIAQLVRASDQSHLWSRTFDNSTENVFEIQDEIAQSVLQALRPSTAKTIVPASERTDVVAYEHYLKGKELRLKWSAESVEAAVNELIAATLIDPDFVPALVELGVAYQALNRVTPRTWAEIEPLAEASLRRAVKIAPDDPKALAELGMFIITAGEDVMAAQPLLERALELNPNDSEALGFYGELLTYHGNFDEALEAMRRAYVLDLNNPERAGLYGWQLSRMGRFEEARTIAQRLLQTRPDELHGHSLLAEIADLEGRNDLAVRHILDELAMNPQAYAAYYNLASRYAAMDDQETAMEWYERTPDPTEDYIPAGLFWTPELIHRELEHRERDIELYPEWDSGQRNYILALFLSRKLEAGVEAVLRYKEAFKTDRFAAATAAAGVMAGRLGQTELSRRFLDRVRERAPRMLEAGYAVPLAHVSLAFVGIADGDHDAAIESLSAYVDSGDANLRYLRMHPAWDPLRDDPRFEAILEKLVSQLQEQRERLRKDGL